MTNRISSSHCMKRSFTLIFLSPYWKGAHSKGRTGGFLGPVSSHWCWNMPALYSLSNGSAHGLIELLLKLTNQRLAHWILIFKHEITKKVKRMLCCCSKLIKRTLHYLTWNLVLENFSEIELRTFIRTIMVTPALLSITFIYNY